MTEFEIPLHGPVGEPVDLYRTFMSHGVADLLLSPIRGSVITSEPESATKQR
jgi:hypothetical protein